MEFSFTVAGERQLDRAIDRFLDGATNLQPAFRKINTLFEAMERRQFEGSGVGPSGKWPPLAPSTLRSKRGGLPILVDTNTLRGSLTGSTAQSEKVIRPLEFRRGTKVDYGIFHQSKAPRGALPRRPFIDIAEKDRRDWLKEIQRHLVARARRDWRN